MKGCVFILRAKRLKELFYGHFFENADAEDLKNFVERSVAAEPFFEDGHQCIDAHRYPQLGTHGIGTGAVKDFDSQMLFEPAKEQFDLPALLVQLRHRQRWQCKMIGQKHQRTSVCRVVKSHSPQFVRVSANRSIFLQADDVVAAQTRRLVHWPVIEAATAQISSGADDEPRSGLFDGIEAPPTRVATVHQVKGPGLPNQLVEPEYVLEGGQADEYLRGQRRMQLQLRMNFQAGALGIETRPRIDRQTQVDDAGVQGVDRLIQIQRQWFLGVKPARLSDEVSGQIREDAPVACGQRVGQGAAFDRTAQTQMIQLIGAGIETGFDVAQTLAPSQLGENQTNKQLPRREVLDFVIAAITFDATVKLLAMKQIQKLGKCVVAGVHSSRIAANRLFEDKPISNRSHLAVLPWTA